ncbi:MAG TPA: anti-sigma factor [Bryobacteraceae bacterium]|nr:anti-sigma factor [Bryobacteraceae bacterium]
MMCEELKDVYELYALGLAEGPEKVEIEAHLARGCESCERGVKDARAMNAMLLATSPSVKPPRRLKRRVMSSVGIKHSGWGWAAGLAAACLLLITLWLGVEERQRSAELADARRTLIQVRGQRDQLRQAMNLLNQPETREIGFGKGQAAPRGNVFVNPSSGVLLVAPNLPPLARGKIYEMWIIPKGGAPRPAGLFAADTSSGGVNLMPGAVDLASLGAVAVTVEPEAGSPAPTSQPIIFAPVAGP